MDMPVCNGTKFWAVAMVFLHRKEEKHIVSAELVVGGASIDDAKAVAISRAKKRFRPDFGPASDWVLQEHTISVEVGTLGLNSWSQAR